jgi:hypothetical protein
MRSLMWAGSSPTLVLGYLAASIGWDEDALRLAGASEARLDEAGGGPRSPSWGL